MNNTTINKIYEAFASASTSHFIFIYNAETKTIRWTEHAKDFFGLSDVIMEYPYTEWQQKIHPDDVIVGPSILEELLNSNKKKVSTALYRIKNKDGSYVRCTVEASLICDDHDKPLYIAGMVDNHQADVINSITNLYSEAKLYSDLTDLNKGQHNYHFLNVSLISFSHVNDVYGSLVGDEVLKSLGDYLLSKFPQYTIYYSENVTYCLLDRTSNTNEGLLNAYKTIKHDLRYNFSVNHYPISLEVGGSITTVEDNSVDANALLSAASYAIHRSKHVLYGELVPITTEGIKEKQSSVKRVALLRNNILHGCSNFYMTYQPILDAKTMEIEGFEALIRYKDDDGNVVSPGLFIPYLEQDTLMYEFSNWILLTALQEGKLILSKYPKAIININLSYSQLESVEFRKDLKNILDATKFPAKNLCLELTERTRLIKPEILNEHIEYLHDLGILVALDDFGTGFSSIAVLTGLSAVDYLKVDHIFVKDIETSPIQQGILQSIVVLCKQLNMKTTIEGVETKGILDKLSTYDVDTYQGYYFSRPVPLMEVLKLELPTE